MPRLSLAPVQEVERSAPDRPPLPRSPSTFSGLLQVACSDPLHPAEWLQNHVVSHRCLLSAVSPSLSLSLSLFFFPEAPGHPPAAAAERRAAAFCVSAECLAQNGFSEADPIKVRIESRELSACQPVHPPARLPGNWHPHMLTA